MCHCDKDRIPLLSYVVLLVVVVVIVVLMVLNCLDNFDFAFETVVLGIHDLRNRGSKVTIAIP